jgi:competence/damage-inducible protein CinA-like protein
VRAEVVAVGTELLLGQIANTNARWISERLATVGADVSFHQTVGDNLERITQALRLAATRADVVVVTGGLGPTQDDITRDALTVVLGAKVERRTEIVDYLLERFRGFGRGEMPESNLRQADVPIGARAIMPQQGTAPGLVAVAPGGATIYAIPGVPSEMVEMMEGTILPELEAQSHSVIASRVLRSSGIGESQVAEILADLFDATPNPSIAFLATGGEVKVRVTAKAGSRHDAEALIAPVVEEVCARLGDAIFTVDDEELHEVVVRLLRRSGRTLGCAESLTGGGVGSRLTAVAGASEVFAGSAVVYTADAKRAILGVPDEVLRRNGVVSEACATAMAAGARRVFASDIAVALTGAAGPEPHGGAEPGTVWIALESDDVHHARGFVSPGERGHVRRWAEQAGLDLVRRYLEGRPLPTSDRVI